MPLAAIACLSALSFPAAADALSDRLRADAAKVSPEDFAWTRTTRAEQRSGDGVESHVLVERWDPAQPPARRWTLVSYDGRPPTADELKQAAKGYATATVPNYGRVARYLGGTLQRLPDANGKAMYRISGLAKGTLMVGGNDVSEDATGELTVETAGAAPYVSQVHFVSTKPVRMMFVAKLDRLEGTVRYRQLADGRLVPAEVINGMTGSMLGQAGSRRNVATFSDWRAR